MNNLFEKNVSRMESRIANMFWMPLLICNKSDFLQKWLVFYYLKYTYNGYKMRKLIHIKIN